MSGPLLSLVADNTTFREPRIEHIINTHSTKKSNHIQEIIANDELLTNLHYSFNRDMDTFLPEYLIFKYTGDNQLDEIHLINELNDGIFEFSIGGNIIWNNTLSFFMKLNKSIIRNNALCIKLPYDIFINEIPIVCLQWHNVSCNIKINRPLPNYEISICYNKIHYHTNERERIRNTGLQLPIQYISSEIVKLNEPSNIIRQRLNFIGLSKGYFLEGNIDEITNFIIKINGFEYLNYNNITLHLYGVRIHENLMFLPFHPNIDYKSISNSSYNEGLNHARIDTIECNISFSSNQTKFTIHSIERNDLLISSGMGGIRFSDRSFIHINYFNYTNTNNTRKLSNIQHWISVNKIINLEKNDECPVSYKKFINGCSYCECNTCKYNIDTETLKQYFNQSDNDSKKCPMCRSPWIDYTIYVNVSNEQLIETNNLIFNIMI